MSVKQSLEENKQHILDSLPTQELKDQFLAELDKADETPLKPSLDEQIKEAQAPDHISKDMYDSVKAEVEKAQETPKMSKEEEEAAIQEALKNPPKSEEE
ncbi:MAG: hypothetical protein RIC95_10450 [Vicingaceae bacterium]